MKGVQKLVVESSQPGDDAIERVVVFLKPDSEPGRVGRAEEKAREYASGLVTWHAGPPRWVWALGGLALLAAAVGLWLLL